MKKILIVLVCLTMLLSLCAPAFAAEKELFRLECEDGEISGAAKDYKDGNIQAVSIASGGFVVGPMSKSPPTANTSSYSATTPAQAKRKRRICSWTASGILSRSTWTKFPPTTIWRF